MKFYLGVSHLEDCEKLKVPYFVSVSRLMYLNFKKPLLGDWMLDSGGFTEIMKHGRYIYSADDYLKQIERYNPPIAFSQDWMCEPVILKHTKKTVQEHLDLTVENYLYLRARSEKVMPVLQGRMLQDYLTCIEAYQSAGVNLEEQPVVGVGTLCRRTKDKHIEMIIRAIKSKIPNARLHGFGLKTTAFRSQYVVDKLYSADSMAWCYSGRRINCGCPGCHLKACTNCVIWALTWRAKVLMNLRGVEGF